MALVHHELCFGCGRTNLFGVLLEVEEREPGVVAGRCFIKQDHQGPEPGMAHEGVVAAALADAIAHARGPGAHPSRLELEFVSGAPVGTYLEIEAHAQPPSAVARLAGATVATASGTYDR